MTEAALARPSSGEREPAEPELGPEAPLPDSPYRGLVPYREQDAPYFFGRERDRQTILTSLLASRLTVLYGSSGVGKTSILQAGVARHLRELARRRREQGLPPGAVVVVFSSWSGDPAAELADEIRAAARQAFAGQPLSLPPAPCPLVPLLEAWTDRAHADLFIILDQFERYFDAPPAADGEGAFAVQLPRAVNHPGLRASFLISIREDALAKLDRFGESIPGLLDRCLRLEHLDRESARAAIEKPVEVYNRQGRQQRREGEAPWVDFEIEPALVEAVLDQVRTGQSALGELGRAGPASGPSPAEAGVETPYLQLVMDRLWREETARDEQTARPRSQVVRLATLDRLGGAPGIARSHLDQALARLSTEQHAIAAAIFRSLVDPTGTRMTLAASALIERAREECEPAPVTDEIVTAVLTTLSASEARVIRPLASAPGQQEPRYEVFHDVLARPIRAWLAAYDLKRQQAEVDRRHAEELAQEQARAALAEAQRRLAQVRLGFVLAIAVLTIALVVVTLPNLRVGWQEVGQYRVPGSPGQAPLTLAVHPDGDRIVLARGRAVPEVAGREVDRPSDLFLASLAVPETGRVLPGSLDATFTSLAFSRDGEYLAAGNSQGRVIVWDARTGLPDARSSDLGTFDGGPCGIAFTRFSASGQRLLAGGICGWRAWELQPSGVWAQIGRDDEPVTGSTADLSPSGEQLLSLLPRGDVSPVPTLIRLDPAAGDIARQLEAPGGRILAVRFVGDRPLAVRAVNESVEIVDLETGRTTDARSDLGGEVNAAYFSDDSSTRAVRTSNRSLIVWEDLFKLGPWRSGYSTSVRIDPARSKAYLSPDGGLLALTTQDDDVLYLYRRGVWFGRLRVPLID